MLPQIPPVVLNELERLTSAFETLALGLNTDEPKSVLLKALVDSQGRYLKELRADADLSGRIDSDPQGVRVQIDSEARAEAMRAAQDGAHLLWFVPDTGGLPPELIEFLGRWSLEISLHSYGVALSCVRRETSRGAGDRGQDAPQSTL